jgi:hypothetical protein
MAITHDAASISVSGPETGAAIRTYITTNALGTVSGLATVLDRNLFLLGDCVLTDAQSTFTMAGTRYINEALGATTNFTDVTIIIGGGSKTQQHTQVNGSIRNWTRVKYLILNQGGGRYDFSGPVGANRENFNTVELFTNASTSFLHIASNANKTLADTTVTIGPSVGSTGIVTQADAGVTITFLRARLNVATAVPKIFIDGPGTVLFDGYGSNATTWTIDRRGSTLSGGGPGGVCTFRDPSKPAGFVGYSFVGANNEFREEMRHNVGIINAAGAGVQSVRVRLRNDTNNSWVYASQTTNATGVITEQFVRTRTRAQNSSTDVVSSAWRVVCTAYGFLKSGGARSFTVGPINERVLMVADPSVALSESAAGALTSIATLDDLYDAIAHGSTRDTDAVLYPSETTFLVTPSGSVLDFEARGIVVDATAAAAFAVDTATNTITVKSTTLTAGAKFKSLKTTGTITAVNGAVIAVPYQDANNAGQISVVGVLNADTVEFRKASDNSLIASRTGPGSFAIAPANVGVSAYFVRLSGSNTVMSTITAPVTLTTGVNPDVPLYAGAEVQVAQAARIEQLPTLAQIEASTLLAKEATVATKASQTSVDAIPTTPLLAANYTAPDNTSITAIKAKTDTLVNGPTLEQIEGSTVLAKESTLSTKASQASVTSLGTPMQAGEVVDANIIKVNDVLIDGAGTQADPFGPV